MTMTERSKQVMLKAALLVLFAIAAFVFLLKSPLHPWVNKCSSTDSSVFQTVAMMMEQGYSPYKDSFDHKGPLLFLYNYLGRQIKTYGGVWYIEFISMLATFLAFYKLARISNIGVVQSVVTVFAAVSLLFKYFGGGNFTEEYAMPFIAISLVVFLDYFINDTVSRARLLVCGGCFGAVLLLRPNMVACWIVFCLAVLIEKVISKKYKEIFNYLIWFACGLGIVLLPFIVWMAWKGILPDFWDAYILFNLTYTSSRGNIGAVWRTFFTFVNTEVCVLAILSLLIMGTSFYASTRKAIFTKQGLLYVSYLLYLLVSLLLLAISGREYGHYGMPLIPALIFPISCLFRYFYKYKTFAPQVLICVYLICSVISYDDWLKLAYQMPGYFAGRNKTHYSKDVVNVVSVVQERTVPNEKIAVYGNWDIIYILSDRPHATRFSYSTAATGYKPELAEEYFSELNANPPRILVVKSGSYNKRIKNFLEENSYQLVFQQNKDNISKSALVFERLGLRD